MKDLVFLKDFGWINLFHTIAVELFDFHLFRFSSGETTEEVARKKIKKLASVANFRCIKWDKPISYNSCGTF